MSSHKARIFYCFLTFLSFSNQQSTQVTDYSERVLTRHLSSKRIWAFKSIPPNSMVSVQIDLFTIYGVMLDSYRKRVTLNGYMRMNWTDPTWSWDPAKFFGLREVTMPSLHAWKPKISLLNSYDENEFREIYSLMPTDIKVTYTGGIIWRPFVQLRINCPLDLRHFPFDKHDCTAIFTTSLFEDRVLLSLSQDRKDSKQIKRIYQFIDEPNEWKVNQLVPVKINNSTVYFSYRFSRRTSYFGIAIFIPLLASTIAAASMFWLPPLVSNKIIVGGVGVLIQCILLMHLLWLVPPSNSIPIVVLVASFQLFLTLTFLLLSGFLVHIISHHHPSVPLPRCIVSCLKGSCGNMLCLNASNEQANVSAQFHSSQEEVTFATNTEALSQIEQIDHNQQNWLLFCKAIDRILFIFYCCSYIAIIVLSSIY